VNAHIYDDQLALLIGIQSKREPYPSPQLHINPDIKTLKDIETWVSLDDFEVTGYKHHEAIKYPFST
jgi:thymidylate synthase